MKPSIYFLIFIFISTCVPYIPQQVKTGSVHSQSDQLSEYGFPETIDSDARYLFYLHGKIIEDQGLPAVSDEYGEYQYVEILETFSGHGFTVISEVRPQDTDSFAYAEQVIAQINDLLAADVPAEHITVVGASKGAGIALLVSHYLGNEDVNYVILSICTPEVVRDLIDQRNNLYGRVLSIYDEPDEYAGSCRDLLDYSRDQGLTADREIELHTGLRHGILYQPLDVWVLPSVEWTLAE
ncbi:MAG: hypothetical protein PWQ55_119 [Chloroflexota bacterium]|nr:hypothetical protein [Chloroflexota bacterium]